MKPPKRQNQVPPKKLQVDAKQNDIWKFSEKRQLLEALQLHSKDDLQSIKTFIPTRSEAEIESFINKMVIKSTQSYSGDPAPIELWLETMESMTHGEADYSSILSKVTSIAANVEPHKPSKSNLDPDYPAIYRYITGLLRGSAMSNLPPLSRIDAAVLLDLIQDLSSHIHTLDTDAQQKFMLHKMKSLQTREDTHNTRRALGGDRPAASFSQKDTNAATEADPRPSTSTALSSSQPSTSGFKPQCSSTAETQEVPSDSVTSDAEKVVHVVHSPQPENPTDATLEEIIVGDVDPNNSAGLLNERVVYRGNKTQLTVMTLSDGTILLAEHESPQTNLAHVNKTPSQGQDNSVTGECEGSTKEVPESVQTPGFTVQPNSNGSPRSSQTHTIDKRALQDHENCVRQKPSVCDDDPGVVPEPLDVQEVLPHNPQTLVPQDNPSELSIPHGEETLVRGCDSNDEPSQPAGQKHGTGLACSSSGSKPGVDKGTNRKRKTGDTAEEPVPKKTKLFSLNPFCIPVHYLNPKKRDENV